MHKPTELTANETEALNKTTQKLRALRDYFGSMNIVDGTKIFELKKSVDEIIGIQGNLANEASLIACILARQFLQRRFCIPGFDAAAKAQGSAGMDIDVLTSDRKRIVGEIKTTVPYEKARRDLGANQRNSFKADFEKLQNAQADHKFFFVTHQFTHDVVKERYSSALKGVELVLLENP